MVFFGNVIDLHLGCFLDQTCRNLALGFILRRVGFLLEEPGVAEQLFDLVIIKLLEFYPRLILRAKNT